MLRLVEYRAVDHARPGEWWRLFTAGFVHFGILHIVFNMFILYLIGQVLEPAIGPWRFTAIYIASLLAGSLGALIIDPFVGQRRARRGPCSASVRRPRSS